MLLGVRRAARPTFFFLTFTFFSYALAGRAAKVEGGARRRLLCRPYQHAHSRVSLSFSEPPSLLGEARFGTLSVLYLRGADPAKKWKGGPPRTVKSGPPLRLPFLISPNVSAAAAANLGHH